MADDSQQRPVVIKRIKKKSGGGGHHGGAWKIAYADFVTAMMAFFLLMWLLGSTNQGELEGIAEYFKTPLKVALAGGSSSGDSSSVIKGGGQDFGILGKQRALLRVVHVGFDGHQAFLAHLRQNFVKQAHQLHVHRLGVFRTLENAGQSLQGRLDGLAGVADEEGAYRRAHDHEDLDGLKQGPQVAARQGETAEYGAQHDDISNNDQHCPMQPLKKTVTGRRQTEVWNKGGIAP